MNDNKKVDSIDEDEAIFIQLADALEESLKGSSPLDPMKDSLFEAYDRLSDQIEALTRSHMRVLDALLPIELMIYTVIKKMSERDMED
jgi:hypothetical protein